MQHKIRICRQGALRVFLCLLLTMLLTLCLISCEGLPLPPEAPDSSEGDVDAHEPAVIPNGGKTDGYWINSSGDPTFDLNGDNNLQYAVIAPKGCPICSEEGFDVCQGHTTGGEEKLYYTTVTPTNPDSETECNLCAEEGFDTCQGHTCYTCNGANQNKCDECDGNDAACKKCNGTGQVRCKLCSGKGIVFYRRYNPPGIAFAPTQP